MKVKIAEHIRIEADIPLLHAERFEMHWKPDGHASLSLEGYINTRIPYEMETLYNSKITLILENGGDRTDETAGEGRMAGRSERAGDGRTAPKKESDEILFCGYVARAERSRAAGTETISLYALSGSYLLDQKEASRSFQSVGNTWAETAREAVEAAGGRVICTAGREETLGRPLIQLGETAWAFARRLAGQLGTCVIPDIVTGGLNLWFGMRKGREIPGFSPEQYTLSLRHGPSSAPCETGCHAESRSFYKIGDQTSFMGAPAIITEVRACMEQGELLFTYALQKSYRAKHVSPGRFAGLGLAGTVVDTKDERIRIALDIDQNVPTGNYYYPWYPNTGNALYAMPEAGARAVLYFPDWDERNGFISECLPEKKEHYSHRDRCLAPEDGNLLQLFDGLISISRGGASSASLGDGSVSIETSKGLFLSAQGRVRLKGKRVHVHSEDEITVYKS